MPSRSTGTIICATATRHERQLPGPIDIKVPGAPLTNRTMVLGNWDSGYQAITLSEARPTGDVLLRPTCHRRCLAPSRLNLRPGPAPAFLGVVAPGEAGRRRV